MTQGKKICNQLKAVRRTVAEANDIPLEIKECTHKGDCAGTCPHCEAEVRYLEQELQKRKRSGKAAVLAGVAMSLSLSGCHTGNKVVDPLENDGMVRGLVAKYEPEKPLMGKPAVPDTIQPPIIEEPLMGIVTMPVPRFPGGEEALTEYLKTNIVYPKEALKQGIEGTVIVEFLIKGDGSISDIRLKQDIGGGCGEEAIRVVKAMPKWENTLPNSDGTPYSLPIEFSLNNKD